MTPGSQEDHQLAEQAAIARKALESLADAELTLVPSQAPLHNQSAFGSPSLAQKLGIQTALIPSDPYSEPAPMHRPASPDWMQSFIQQARRDNSDNGYSGSSSPFSDLWDERPENFVQVFDSSEQCAQGHTDALVPHMLPVAGPCRLVEQDTTSMFTPATTAFTLTKRKVASLFVCSTCQRKFTRRTILVNHERTHTDEKPFSCSFDECSQTFSQRGDKTRHEQAQHTKKTFRCGSSQGEGPTWGCGKTFRRKDGLLEHHTKTKKGKQCLADRDELM